jgi:hypothetical protein
MLVVPCILVTNVYSIPTECTIVKVLAQHKALGFFKADVSRLEENITASLEGKALNPINPSTYGTFIRDHTIVTNL